MGNNKRQILDKVHKMRTYLAYFYCILEGTGWYFLNIGEDTTPRMRGYTHDKDEICSLNDTKRRNGRDSK